MKKILVFAAAMASMLFAASCQKENFSSAEQGADVVTATLTIQAPGMPGTKAMSADQNKVGDGLAADNLVFAVFDENGDELPNLRQGDWVNGIGDVTTEVTFDNSATPTTTVTVTLVRGKVYTFVCWAQNKAATCYDFKDMKNIGIDYTEYNAANNDLRDAFYACVQTEKVTENFSQTVVLKRPFAQINVGTADFVEAQKAGLEIDNLYSTMIVKNAATSLETFTGKASNPVELTYEYAHAIAPEDELVINKNLVQNNPQGTIADRYDWLAMNYILVADGSANGEGSALVDVAFEVREGADVVLTSYDVPNVPVQRNFRTNIVGSLLTAEGDITIIIDPIFNGEYVVDVWDGLSTSVPASDADGYYVTTAAELAWVAEQVNKNGKTFEGETVYLAADVDLAGQMWTPIGGAQTPFMGTFEVLANTSLLTKSTTEYYAIYGLNVDYTEGPAGLFGWIKGAAVKNVTLVNPQVKGESCVAAVVGKIFNTGLVEGCTVKGGSVYGNHYVAGIAAHAYGTIKNNVVDGTVVTGVSVNEDLDGDKVGGIVGLHAADAKSEVSANQILAVTIVAKRDAGALVGAANADNVKGNHVETATVGSTEALIEKNADVIVGRVLAGTLNPKANTYNHEQITVNGVQAEPAVIEFTAEAASEEALPVEGGEYVINVTSNVAWTVTASEGLTVKPAEGEGNAQVVVTVPANELYEAVSYQVTVATEEAADVKEFAFTINQVAAEPEYEKVTVAEFMNKKEGKYELTGVITKIYQAYNSQYKNIAFYLNDGSVEGDGVIVYRMSCDGIEDPANTIVPGCTITVQGACSIYNNVAQMGAGCVCVAYEPFVAKESEWGVVGDLTGWGSSDIKMVTTWHTENLFVAYNVEIASGSFKIRANNQWNDAKNYGLEVAGSIYADSYYKVITSGGSQNITPMQYGKYDVYFDLTNKRVALMTPGKAYAEAVDGGKPVVVVAGLKDHEWGLVGSFNGWDAANYVVTEVKGDWAVAKNVTLEKNAEFKFAADKAWTLSYGTGSEVKVGETYTTYNNGGNMKFVGEAGAYDVYFSLVDASFYMTEAVVNVVGGTDDFATITATNTNYVSGKTTAGWNYKNCAIFKGGTSDSSPAFKMIGDASNRALCMNGKTSGVGSITSPTFTTGCGTLKFNYGLPFSDTKLKFRVDIMQDGAVVHTFTINNASATKLTAYSHEETVNVSGDFQIVFTNLSPSNNTGNKDRTAIWDVEWTGCN